LPSPDVPPMTTATRSVSSVMFLGMAGIVSLSFS
jgi:hypothetical protein